MPKLVRVLLLFSVISISLILTANLEICYSKDEKKIIMAASLSIPPYIIKEDNTGLELEIVKEALKS